MIEQCGGDHLHLQRCAAIPLTDNIGLGVSKVVFSGVDVGRAGIN